MRFRSSRLLFLERKKPFRGGSGAVRLFRQVQWKSAQNAQLLEGEGGRWGGEGGGRCGEREAERKVGGVVVVRRGRSHAMFTHLSVHPYTGDNRDENHHHIIYT